MQIVVVGSLNMDLVVRIPVIPKPGETLLGGNFMTFPGGKGANQAVAAARLGGRVSMVGCVGDDAMGIELKNTLDREGINTSQIHLDKNSATGVALIEVDANGQNSIALASGANYTLKVDDIKDAFDAISQIDLLIVQLEIAIEVVSMAVKLANEKGARVILNPAPAQTLFDGLLKQVDIIVPNEFETHFLTDIHLQNEMDYQKASGILIGKGVKNVILTLGKQGAYLVEANNKYKPHQIHSFNVKTVDTTAAGDCFIGALAVGLCENMPLQEAAYFASAAAALSVTRMGAQASLPNRIEVDQFINERDKKQ